MKRRRLLVTMGAALFGTAGCLRRLTVDEADGPPSVDTPTVELGLGEEATVTVTAENVGSMSINTLVAPADSSRESRPVVGLDEENLSPSPTSVAESMPPDWNWSPPRATISYEAPVRVPSDVSPGVYDYPVTVSKDGVRESGPIRVRVCCK
ncbi:hypothetical protein [Halovenus sp. HT40]|uniref:hypothetical protein n=1 Tax=Halovenus sp. HT40 TaxID=3126691 RepID=UPI00300F5AF3